MQVSMFVVGCNGVPEDIGVQLDHVRFIRSHADDIAALLATFGVREVGCREEWGGGGCAHENHVCCAHVFLEEAGVFCVRGCEEVSPDFGIIFPADGVDVAWEIGLGVIEAHYTLSRGVEVAGYDV